MRLLGSVAAALLAIVLVSSALGHAEPERLFPGDGAVLVEPPNQVVLLMTQEMFREAGANDIDVFDAGGREVTEVEAIIDNADRRRLTVPLPASIPPGEYTVRWKTLSAEDGDTTDGTYSFTFDPEGTASPGTEVVRESLLNPTPQEAGDAQPSPLLSRRRDDGVSWVLVVAVGVGMFVIGAGGTFLLVQKRP